MLNVRHRWTVDDLQDLPEDGNRYEAIDGELLGTPAPTWAHQAAVGRLSRVLAEYLDVERVGTVLFAPADVVFSPNRGLQPDVFVAPLFGGRRPERFEEVGKLLLAVEVLSPSTARADRVAKRVVYREQGVPEYWIVDLDSRTVERSTPADARVEVLAERLDWRPNGSSSPLSIDLIDYFGYVLDG